MFQLYTDADNSVADDVNVILYLWLLLLSQSKVCMYYVIVGITLIIINIICIIILLNEDYPASVKISL